MMYPFMTLEDKTEIVHSDVYMVNGVEPIKVYFENLCIEDFVLRNIIFQLISGKI